MATHKYAVPGHYVRGASLVRDPDTLQIEFDAKGRPIWDMPQPAGVHVTKQAVKKTLV